MDRADFLDLFFEESDSRLRELEAWLPRLRHAPGDPEALNLSFRCVHSLKGGSAMMGFTEITRLAHALETVLDHLRSGRRPVTPAIVDTLLASADVLHVIVNRARSRTDASSAERETADRIVAALDAFGGVTPSIRSA
jgi:two-component system, chemotaxis family, sensor kinase CheA